MEDEAERSVEATLWRWRPRTWRPWRAPAVEAAMEDGAATMEDGDEGRWRRRSHCRHGEGSRHY
jgi:hypothetical protein